MVEISMKTASPPPRGPFRRPLFASNSPPSSCKVGFTSPIRGSRTPKPRRSAAAVAARAAMPHSTRASLPRRMMQRTPTAARGRRGRHAPPQHFTFDDEELRRERQIQHFQRQYARRWGKDGDVDGSGSSGRGGSSGGISDGTTLQESQRGGNDRTFENLIDGRGLLVLGPCIVSTMAVVLHGDCCELLVCYAKLVLVPRSGHPVEGWHSEPLCPLRIRRNG